MPENRLNRYARITTLAILALSASVAVTPCLRAFGADAAQRPNILFIMSDDHAAHAIGCYGSAINKTPHLDRLAKAGMRFDRCFVTNSICTPSRATILTGKYSHSNGVPVFNSLDQSQPTVAKYLQAAGYHTGMIGKWHMGGAPVGFDKWSILPGQGAYMNPAFLEEGGSRVIQGYVTDIIADLSIDFLKNRPKDKPFFLMCHHKAPHRSWEPNEKYRAMFAGQVIPEPATLRDGYATRTDAIRECKQKVFDDMTRRDLKLQPPADLPPAQRNQWLGVKPKEVEIEIDGQKKTLSGEELNRWKYQRYMQDYLACVQSVDDNVGRLLDFLDTNGLAANTVVIYTSDQGFFLGDHGLYDKRFMYEHSLKMPFLVRWPAAIKLGSVQEGMAINADFAPTFMELAGQPVPPDMQGRSLLPLFKGAPPADWRTSMYYRYYHDPGDHDTRAHYGVRTLTHKLIHYWKKDQWELYDLVTDPNELQNLYPDPAQQELAAKLKEELSRLKKQLQDDDQFARELPPAGVDGGLKKGSEKKAGKKDPVPGIDKSKEQTAVQPAMPEPAPTAGKPKRLVAPFDKSAAVTAQQEWAAHVKQKVGEKNSIDMKLVLIPPGEFQMGAPAGETEARSDERPQHLVRITQPYHLGQYEVTRGQYTRFATETKAIDQGWKDPGFAQDDEHPVVNVSWEDATKFCEWLSAKEDKSYRLPTEAEWEYACRAGTLTRYYSGDDVLARMRASHFFVAGDGYETTAPVGRFQSNGFGLQDVQGNVWEWCGDWYRDSYYGEIAKKPAIDPQGPLAGSYRVYRGGSWAHSAWICRSAFRYGCSPSYRNALLGFRVLRTP